MSDLDLACPPYPICADTWLLPSLHPLEQGLYLGQHSMVIRGREPMLVDTGGAGRRDEWLAQAWSLVEPADVRWIFLTHDDPDHAGNVATLLELCTRATLLTDYLTYLRMSCGSPLPLHRMRWLNDGDGLDIGDRRITALLPPLFDSPSTRGLLDERTGVFWGADCFLGPVPVPTHEVDDLPPGTWEELFVPFNALLSPWHRWLDPERYGAHVAQFERLPLTAVVSAHSPVVRADRLPDAWAMTRSLASTPPVPLPGQALLECLRGEALEVAHGG